MEITPTKLRKNIYKLLDQVALKGKKIEIQRKGVVIEITSKNPKKSKLDNLKKRNILNCDPEDIINNNWEKEWKEEYF